MAEDGVSVSATVDRNHMRPGDTFTYTISITSEGSESFDQPRLPDLRGFEVLSSWSGSETRGTFINGQVQTQRSQTFNYMLSATEPGSHEISAAEVVVNGKVMRTNPIAIKVDNSAPQGPAHRAPTPGVGNGIPDPEDVDQMDDDIFSQLLRRRLNPRGKSADVVNTKDAFFIHVEADKTKVYQGEQITASWYLVTRVNIADIDTLKYPSLSGFWKEDIEIATRLNFQPEIVNGIRYQKALLARYALFPIKAGPAVIDPYQARCKIVDMMGFGFPQEQNITKESKPITFDAMPLPANGKPSDFSGGVGQFTVQAKVDSEQIKTNSPVTLKIRIEGQGNAKVIDMPKLNIADSVHIYDPKVDMKFFANGRSYKEFETLLVPSATGDLKIPSIPFTFFDPEKKAYYTESTSELIIRVEQGVGPSNIPSEKSLLSNEPVQEIKKVLPGILETPLSVSSLTLAQQLSGWAVLFILSIISLVIYAKQMLGQKKVKEKFSKMIRRRSAEIKELINKNEWRKVGVETTNLIYIVLAEVSQSDGESFDFNSLIENSPPSFRRTLAPQLKELMSKLEIVGFAPESAVGSLKEKTVLTKLVSDAENLLIESSKYDFSSADAENV